jgi:hypothetical protein
VGQRPRFFQVRKIERITVMNKLPHKQGVYGILINGELRYIGSSQYMDDRQAEHLYDIRRSLHEYFKSDDAVDFIVLEYVEGWQVDLQRREYLWISSIPTVLNKITGVIAPSMELRQLWNAKKNGWCAGTFTVPRKEIRNGPKPATDPVEQAAILRGVLSVIYKRTTIP